MSGLWPGEGPGSSSTSAILPARQSSLAPLSGDTDKLDDELDELTSEADVNLPRPRPLPLPTAGEMLPSELLVPRTPLPPPVTGLPVT